MLSNTSPYAHWLLKRPVTRGWLPLAPAQNGSVVSIYVEAIRLPGDFPQTVAAAVATAAIGGDKQLPGIRYRPLATHPLLHPGRQRSIATGFRVAAYNHSPRDRPTCFDGKPKLFANHLLRIPLAVKKPLRNRELNRLG